MRCSGALNLARPGGFHHHASGCAAVRAARLGRTAGGRACNGGGHTLQTTWNPVQVFRRQNAKPTEYTLILLDSRPTLSPFQPSHWSRVLLILGGCLLSHLFPRHAVFSQECGAVRRRAGTGKGTR